MGSVYQVVDRTRNARVALKSVGRVSGDALLRFKHEFRALQELQHDNVVQLGELFEQDGAWFFTMELVLGTDFLSHTRPALAGYRAGMPTASSDAFAVTVTGVAKAEELASRDPEYGADAAAAGDSGGFDEVRLRRGLAQLAQALAAVHRHGHVHRDVKPGNVLVNDEGRVVLIDFGLVAGATDELTGEHQVVGTVAYMSPEQGLGGVVGPESDWYAVGVMLYEVLTGVRPFVGRGLQLLMRKQTELPPRPRQLNPAVPEDLDELCMDLLQIDPSRRPTDRMVLSRLHVEQPRAAGPRSESGERIEEFVGRGDELLRLTEQLGKVLRGHAAVATIAGRSGLGKSALLRRFGEQVATDQPEAVVFEGRCYEQESVPYKALDAVMDQLSLWLKRLPEPRVQALLPEDIGTLARAFPVLERVPQIARARREQPELRDPQQQRLRLMRTLRALFGAVARELPVVVLIDDFHWSDEDSRRMLDELTGPPDPPPLLLVLAMRTEQKIAPQGVTLELSPLSAAQSVDLATRLARHVAGAIEPTRLEAVARQAEGYPFFVEALLFQPSTANLDDKIDLDRVILSAVSGIGAEARRLIEVICFAGGPVSQTVAAQAAMLSPAEASQPMHLLRRSKLVRTEGLRASDLVEPYHDRIRQTVIKQLAVDEAPAVHARLAEALERTNGALEQIARHLREAGQREKAAQYFLSAADRAMATLAFGYAADLFAEAEAVAVLPPDELQRLRVRRANALASAGRGQQAAAVYKDAIPGSTPAEAVDLKRRIAEQLLTAGFHAEGLAACNEFVGDLGIDFPRSPRTALFRIAMLEIYLRMRGLGYRIDPTEQHREEDLTRIDGYWAMAKGLAAHDPMRAQFFQVRGLIEALKLGEPHRITRALAMHALSVAFLDPSARPRADEVLAGARRLVERSQNPLERGIVSLVGGMLDYVGHCRWHKLDLAEAEHIFRTECEGVAWELDFCSISQKQCQYWLGQWQKLYVGVHDQIKEAEERGDRYLGVQIRSHWMSFFAALEGDYARGHAEADYAFGPSASQPSPVESLFNLLSHTRVDLCEGKGHVALQRVESYEPGLLGSLALKATIYRTMFESTRLLALLAVARASEGPERTKRYKQAADGAKKFPRSGVECTTPLSELVLAAVAAARDDNGEALRLLERAEGGFLAQGMMAHHAVVRRRKGQLLGGREGAALVEDAERWLAAQGARNFADISRLIAPGFPAEA